MTLFSHLFLIDRAKFRDGGKIEPTPLACELVLANQGNEDFVLSEFIRKSRRDQNFARRTHEKLMESYARHDEQRRITSAIEEEVKKDGMRRTASQAVSHIDSAPITRTSFVEEKGFSFVVSSAGDISIDVRGETLSQAVSAISAVLTTLADHKPNVLSSNDLQRISSEIKAGRELLESPKANKSYI